VNQKLIQAIIKHFTEIVTNKTKCVTTLLQACCNRNLQVSTSTFTTWFVLNQSADL